MPDGFVPVRDDVRAAVAQIVAAGAERIVVVVPGDAAWGRDVLQGLHPTFRAAGIDDERSGLTGVVVGATLAGSGTPPVDPLPVDDVPAAIGLALLADASWGGAVEVVGTQGEQAVALRRLGTLLAEDDIAILLVGGLSARRGPDAPLAEDPRAAAVDEAILADLSRLGTSDQDAAVARLAGMDAALAEALAISAWGPWQVLLGALTAAGGDGPAMRAAVSAGAPAGATYAVALWVAA